MAVRFNPGTPTIESRPKKTRQGKSARTKLSATSRNHAKKEGMVTWCDPRIRVGHEKTRVI